MATLQASKVILMKNVPLDKSYENTLYFESESQQTTFFLNRANHTLENLSFIRETSEMKIPIPYSHIYETII